MRRIIYGQLKRPNFVANIDQATELHNTKKTLNVVLLCGRIIDISR